MSNESIKGDNNIMLFVANNNKDNNNKNEYEVSIYILNLTTKRIQKINSSLNMKLRL